MNCAQQNETNFAVCSKMDDSKNEYANQLQKTNELQVCVIIVIVIIIIVIITIIITIITIIIIIVTFAVLQRFIQVSLQTDDSKWSLTDFWFFDLKLSSSSSSLLLLFCKDSYLRHCKQTIQKDHQLISMSWTWTDCCVQAQFYNKLMPAVFNSLQVAVSFPYMCIQLVKLVFGHIHLSHLIWHITLFYCQQIVEFVKHFNIEIQFQDMDEQRVKCIQTFMRKSAQTEQVNCFPPYDWLTHISCNNIGIWNITHLSWIQCQKFSPGRASNHSPVSWGHPALHRFYGWKRGWKRLSNILFANVWFWCFTQIWFW